MMTGLIIVALAVLGAVFGSFANVCIWRLPREESVVWPSSHCPACGNAIRARHLVPVLSWLVLRGKCADCNGPISIRYPLVELAMAVLFAVIGWRWQLSIQTLTYCILTLALVIAAATDFSHREIPDQVSLGASAVLAAIALLTPHRWEALLGGAILFGFLLLIAVASRGGMGGGDIKLSLAIGLALGWRLGIVALIAAFFAGGLLAVGLLLKGARGKTVPFGPFLALGAWVAMFFGQWLIDVYWSLSFLLWGW